MRILHVLNTNSFSGAENVVCQIINMLRDQDDIEMLYCSPNGPISDILEKHSIQFVPIQKLCKQELKRVIRQYQPGIIHAHDRRASIVAAGVCGNIKLISHIHNNSFDSQGLTMKSIAYLVAGFKAKSIFWVSRSAFKGYFFNRLLKRKSQVLYNIIDLDLLYKEVELDQKIYDFDVIYLGRLSSQKNPHRLLQVFSLLVEKKTDIKIIVVGDGEMKQEVEDEAEKMMLQENVLFVGFKPNPAKLLHNSKIMVMTSLFEGTPMCALEAMALGTPIVSTPVDGMQDLISNDENGYLSDDNNTIANKIIEYLTDEKKLKYLSENQVKKSIEWNNKEQYKNLLIKAYMG